MKLDRTFAREIKKAANGDGSREARFAFLNPAKEAVRKLSIPNVRDEFGDILQEYGRATVGICVAVTVWERRDRLESRTVRWCKQSSKTGQIWPGSIPVPGRGIARKYTSGKS